MIKTLALSLLTFCAISLQANDFKNNKPYITSKTGKTTGPANDSLKLDSMIKKQAFKFQNNTFIGEGWDKLVSMVQKSHFVLIGEDHGLAEVPVFSTHISDVLKPAAVVTEIDPYTAIELKKISAHPSGFSAYFKQHPYAFSFYSYQTEMDMIRDMQLKHIDVWGLNEINLLSFDRFFLTLSENAKSPANKKLALDKSILYAKADRPCFFDVDKYGAFSAYTLKAATVDSIIYEFRNENMLCKQMLDNLKLSVPAFTNNPEGYYKRINLMKKNLLNYLGPNLKAYDISVPKLLFKFGANHVTRSNDVTGRYEVGNLADNLAEAAGKQTLHLLVLGKNGTVNTLAPVNNTKAIKQYDGLESFKVFYDKVNADEWAIFDLRPIRRAIFKHKLTLKEGQLKDFIMGYDILVVFGKTTGNPFIE